MTVLILILLFIIIPVGSVLTVEHFYTKFQNKNCKYMLGESTKPQTIYYSNISKPEEFPKTDAWNKIAQNTIKLVEEYYTNPKTIKIIGNNNEQKSRKTLKTKRIRKGSNKRVKKNNKTKRSGNKTVTKKSRIQSK